MHIYIAFLYSVRFLLRHPVYARPFIDPSFSIHPPCFNFPSQKSRLQQELIRQLLGAANPFRTTGTYIPSCVAVYDYIRIRIAKLRRDGKEKEGAVSQVAGAHSALKNKGGGTFLCQAYDIHGI